MSFSQVGLKNNDTIFCLNRNQINKINSVYLEREYFQKQNDSLILLDSLNNLSLFIKDSIIFNKNEEIKLKDLEKDLLNTLINFSNTNLQLLINENKKLKKEKITYMIISGVAILTTTILLIVN